MSVYTFEATCVKGQSVRGGGWRMSQLEPGVVVCFLPLMDLARLVSDTAVRGRSEGTRRTMLARWLRSPEGERFVAQYGVVEMELQRGVFGTKLLSVDVHGVEAFGSSFGSEALRDAGVLAELRAHFARCPSFFDYRPAGGV